MRSVGRPLVSGLGPSAGTALPSAGEFAGWSGAQRADLLHRLAGDRRGVEKGTGGQIMALIKTAQKELPQLPALESVRILHSVHRLARELDKDVAVFSRLWIAAAEPNLASFDEHQLSLSLHTLMRMGLRRREVRSFVERWVAVSTPRLPSFEPQQLSNSIYALGSWRFSREQIGGEWFGEWARSAVAQLGRFSAQHLANSIYALGRLKVGPDVLGEAFFVAWMERAADELPRFLPVASVNALMALRTLEVQPIGVFIERFLVVSTRQGLDSSLNLQTRLDALDTLAALRVDKLTPNNQLLGLEWYRQWVEVMEPQLSRLSVPQLVMVMRSLARLGLNTNLIAESFYEEWGRAMGPRLHELDAGGLYELARAFGRLKQKDHVGQELVINVAEQCLAASDEYTAEQLMHIVGLMQRVRLTDAVVGQDWFRLWIIRATPLLQECDGRQLSLMLTSLAHTTNVQVIGMDYVRKWGERAQSQSFSRQHLIGALWALNALGLSANHLGEEAIQHLKEEGQRFPREWKRPGVQKWVASLVQTKD